MSGWIKSHRTTLENPIVCKDSDYFFVWHYLLLKATHKEYDIEHMGKRLTLKKGQLKTSAKSISEFTKVNIKKVERILKVFKSEEQIEKQGTPKGTVITIKNWIKYQSSEEQDEEQVRNKRGTSEEKQEVKERKNEKNDNKQIIEMVEKVENLELKESIIAFVDMRKYKKKDMTLRAFKMMVKKLNEMTLDTNKQIEILNQSTINGWSDIYPLKKEQQKVSFKDIEKQKANDTLQEVLRSYGH